MTCSLWVGKKGKEIKKKWNERLIEECGGALHLITHYNKSYNEEKPAAHNEITPLVTYWSCLSPSIYRLSSRSEPRTAENILLSAFQ